MNDDYGCSKQFAFPLKAITEFGKNQDGQIIFLYCTPHLTGKYNTSEMNRVLLDKQKEFIENMHQISGKGKARVFFYKIPDDAKEKAEFFNTYLQNSIPATIFEIFWERFSKIFATMVAAARG